jgi:hypothetical protein
MRFTLDGWAVRESHGSGPSTCHTSTVASTAACPSARATEMRWCPSRTKYMSLTCTSATGGSALPPVDIVQRVKVPVKVSGAVLAAADLADRHAARPGGVRRADTRTTPNLPQVEQAI